MKDQLYKFTKEHWFMITLILGISVGFILLFSYSTSPLSWYYNGDDASIPVTIARGWYFNIIPYKDLFTTNGPWMYWLGKIGIGFAHGNKGGLIIPQIINLFFFFLSVYFISQLTTKNKIYSCLVIALTILSVKINYPDGMYTEEFLLPWIGWTYYFVFSYFKDHSWNIFKSLFIGISIGVTALCEVTGLIAFIPILFLYLYFLYQRQWKMFFFSLATLVLGIFIIVIPFLLYFHQQACLNELIYDVFQYKVDTLYESTKTPYYYKILFQYRFSIFAPLFASIFSLLKKNWKLSIIYIFISIIECLYFFQMNFATHLSMFCAINIVLLCNSIYVLFPFKKHQKTTMILCLTMTFVAFYRLYLNDLPKSLNIISSYSIYNNEGWEGLVDMIPSEDYDKVVIYGNKTLNNTYLLTNAMPCYKYFYQQDEIAESDPNLEDKIKATFSTKKAKWILTDRHTDVIQELLDSDYTLVGQNGIYNMYQSN